MVFVHTAVVQAPLAEVFAWHTRPGAFTRLAPPWQPVRVAAEARSLRDGHAVLAMPGGLRWVAEHVPQAYDPPHQFVDELVSWPLRQVVSWRHTHEFTDADETSTRITDRIDTRVPAAMLRSMFTYRHRQLVGDLAAHQWAAEYHRGLTVGITEPESILGSALAALLTTGGHTVIRLVCRPPRHADERQWQPENPAPDLLDGMDALAHLAAQPVLAQRTESRASRANGTRQLAELAAGRPQGPGVFVTASSADIYGADRGGAELAESSSLGTDVRAETVAARERATDPAADAGWRVVYVRPGVVHSARAGVLRALHPLFAAGLGHQIGDGRQWTSWIGLDDLIDVYYRALIDPRLSGALNAVAPEPVHTHDYVRTLATVLRRPCLPSFPPAASRVLVGAHTVGHLAEPNRRLLPQRLLEREHSFRHPQLEQLLRHQLGRAD